MGGTIVFAANYLEQLRSLNPLDGLREIGTIEAPWTSSATAAQKEFQGALKPHEIALTIEKTRLEELKQWF